MPADFPVLGLAIAVLGGAAVGLERERSGHAHGKDARFAGIRTFTLLGLVGGLGGAFWHAGLGAPAVVLLAGAVGLIVAAYAAASRRDIDGTTEVAALIVVAAGVLSGMGSYRLGSGIVAITTLVLAEKSRLHALVRRIDDVGLQSAARFGVMALVVLPLLPVGPFGPLGGVRPRELWALVLFFSGLSFLGYVAHRAVGARAGYLIAGLLGGLVSSTNTTFTFARLSRREPANARVMAFGAIAANAVLYPRVLVAAAVLQAPLVGSLWPYLAGPALVAAGVAAVGWWRADGPASHSPVAGNPLQLGAALRLALLFQIVMMAVSSARGLWGSAGLLASAAVIGVTDVDAVTVSMARSVSSGTPVALAATAIATGVLANSLLKLGIAVVLGERGFRMIAGPALLAISALGAIALWVLSPA